MAGRRPVIGLVPPGPAGVLPHHPGHDGAEDDGVDDDEHRDDTLHDPSPPSRVGTRDGDAPLIGLERGNLRRPGPRPAGRRGRQPVPSGGSHEPSPLGPRPLPGPLGLHRRGGSAQHDRPRPVRGGLGLPAALARRAPQHPRARQLGAGGDDRAGRGGHDAHPRRRRRDHAPQPRAPPGGRDLPRAGGALPRPHRPGHRAGARHRSGDGDRAPALGGGRSPRTTSPSSSWSSSRTGATGSRPTTRSTR